MAVKTIKTNEPCDVCGSSRGKAYYDDGHSFCYSCKNHIQNDPYNSEGKPAPKKTTYTKFSTGHRGTFEPIADRGLHVDVCKKYSYYIGDDTFGNEVHIANFRDDSGNIIGQKIRSKDKKFSTNGDITGRFFGQNLFINGGRMLVCTEGEIDCLTVSQLQGNKYPVCSLPNGVGSTKRVFQKNLKWLDKFEKVILMFDEDEHGRKAVEEAACIMPPGKTYVARLSEKDANEMLLKGKGKEVIDAIWTAKKWSPSSIINGADLFERISKPNPNNDSIPYPFDGLNNLTRGIRKGEISLFCAGSGVGKSQVCRQIAHHLLKTTDEKVGYIALEENVERSSQGILGIEIKKLLHLEPFEVDEEYRKGFDATIGSGRFFVYDHWGSLDTEELLSHVRYMIKAEGVTHIVLDHISIVVSGMPEAEMGNERKAIDVLMTKLRALVEEANVALLLVSHLKRPEGNRGYEDGLAPTLSSLRGSQSLSQLADMVISLSRNLQGEDKHTTTVTVLKNRFSGQTGIATFLEYDTKQGILNETNYEGDFSSID